MTFFNVSLGVHSRSILRSARVLSRSTNVAIVAVSGVSTTVAEGSLLMSVVERFVGVGTVTASVLAA